MKRDYLSVSALKAFAKSPNHYIQYCTQPRGASKAMVLGSAIHCAILEPDEFHKRYAVHPKVDRRTKAGKQAYDNFLAAAAGKELLSPDDHETLVLVRNAVENNPHSAHLLRQSIAKEQVRQEPLEGVSFKSIADIVGPTFVADLKTTQDASPENFSASAGRLGYHLQAAAYRNLWRVPTFYWIAVETHPPYNVCVYKQGEMSYEKADRRLRELINRWSKWDGQPQSYSRDILDLELPHWM